MMPDFSKAWTNEQRRRVGQQNSAIAAAFALYVFWWLGNTGLLSLDLTFNMRAGLAILAGMGLQAGAMRATVSPYQLLALTAAWLLMLPDGYWLMLLALLWLAHTEVDGWAFLFLGAACALAETYLVTEVFGRQGVAVSPLAQLGAVSAVWVAVVISRFQYRTLGLAAAVYLLPGIPGLHEAALALTALGSVARLALRPVGAGGATSVPGGPSPHNSSSRFARPDEIPGMRR